MTQKRKMRNRVLSLFLVLVLVLSVLPITSRNVNAAVAAWSDTKIKVVITDLVYTDENGITYNYGSSGWDFDEYEFVNLSDGKYQFSYKATFKMDGDGTAGSAYQRMTETKTVTFDGIACNQDYSKKISQEYSFNRDKWTYDLLITRSCEYGDNGHSYGEWQDNKDGTTHTRSCKIHSEHKETAEHHWKDATCSVPQTCECGATQGEVSSDAHSWNAATCVLPKTCEYCKKTEGEALGHEIVAASFSKPAACSRCGATDLEQVVLKEALINTDISLPTQDIKADNTGYEDITWSIIETGTTGATLNGNTLKATNAGTAKIRAVAANETKEFSIEFKSLKDIDISQGAVTISKKDENTLTVKWNGFAGGSKDYSLGEPIVISCTTKPNSCNITVEKSTVANIWLKDVSITSTTASCIEVCEGAEATITLYGQNILSTTAQKCSAIHGKSGAKVTIDGSGSLQATGGKYRAGIGGGTITINGGTVTAKGGERAAGIGDGPSYETITNITINGGTVTATGGEHGAGIGGGYNIAGGTITINGGTVIATGGKNGAGIGGGYNAAGGSITISGGTVTAKGGERAAGIGGGYEGAGGTVVITGGTVKATGTKDTYSNPSDIGGGGSKTSPGTLTNGTDNVVLYPITLNGVTAETSITKIEGVGIYGLKDVKTIETNKLYLYLPSDAKITSITAGDVDYICHDNNNNYDTDHDWSKKDGVCTRCGKNCEHPSVINKVCQECGETIHTHSWTYAVSEENKTITATCSNTDNLCKNTNGGSVTLKATDSYYGNATAATTEGSFTNGATYTITYENGETTAPNTVGKHTTKLTVSESGTEKASVTKEYNISYLPVPEAAYSISSDYKDENGTYWCRDSVTVSAPEGYTIAKALKGDYKAFVRLSSSDDKEIYLKNEKGEMTDKISITETISFDRTAPTGKIEIKDRATWKTLLNKISFGWFFKSAMTASVTAEDVGSGVKTVEYYLAESDLIDSVELSDASAIQKLETAVKQNWTTYDKEISLKENSKNVVYVKIKDQVGNITYINSEGIVLYTDAQTDTKSVTTVYKAGMDKEVNVTLNGNTIQSVSNGNTVLVKDTDYTVDGGEITLKGSYLDTLNGGNHTFTVSYDPLGLEYVENNKNEKPNTTTFTVYIEKADGSVTDISAIGKTYDGNPVSNPTYTSLSTGTASYEYKAKGADDNTYTTTAPATVGEYMVRVTVAADENYKAASATADFTITNADLTDVSVQQSGSLSYTGKPQTATVTTKATAKGNQTVTFTYSAVQDGTYTESIPTFTTKGTYPVYYKASADNHNTASGQFDVTIGAAENEWTTAPSISDWTYGENAKTPSAAAKFGEVSVTYTGTANDGSAYNSTTAPTEAGSYKAVFTVPATEDYTALTEEVSFTIAKADQAAPIGLTAQAETIDGKADGKITGVDASMEYRKDNEQHYIAISGTELTNLADGTYYIRYKADNNQNASSDKEIVLKGDTKLTVTVPNTQTGYTLTVSNSALKWNESTTITFTLKEGYSRLNDSETKFAVKVNGEPKTLDENGTYTIENVQTDITVTVEGVADITAPTAEITLGENKWNQFWNSITFGLFFKDTQKVTIAAEDKGSGVSAISYYLATEELSKEQVTALPAESWIPYETEAFSINPQEEYIIYAKASDKDGNTAYISSEKGIVADSIAPVISGIANGETHYGDTTFAVTEKYIDTVKVDGNPVTLTGGTCTIKADGKEHTVVATDKSGNTSAEIKISVLTIDSIDDSIENITMDHVKSSDKKEIEKVLDLVNSLINSGKDFTETEEAQLVSMKENTEKLIKKIEAALESLDQAKPGNSSTTGNTSKETKQATPATGDENQLALWFVLAVTSMLGMGFFKKKKYVE